MLDIHETFDADLLTDLNEEIQTFHHHAYPEIFKPFDKVPIRSFFKSILERGDAHVFVAQETNIVLGYALLFIVEFGENPFQYSRKYILLDQILVMEKYRARGAGTSLLHWVYDFAKSLNINEIELNHWTRNVEARKFFKMNGFEYFNERMWKKLN
jgi:GNAT superfamily N-acetyltransferase